MPTLKFVKMLKIIYLFLFQGFLPLKSSLCQVSIFFFNFWRKTPLPHYLHYNFIPDLSWSDAFLSILLDSIPMPDMLTDHLPLTEHIQTKSTEYLQLKMV